MVKGSKVSVRPDSVGVEFDDERLIANVGLILIATLSRRLGIESLVDKTVRLGERVGRPPAVSMALLGHKAMAPSTLGTFLRAFTFGHVRQLDRVLGEGNRARLGGRSEPRRGAPGDRHRQLPPRGHARSSVRAMSWINSPCFQHCQSSLRPAAVYSCALNNKPDHSPASWYPNVVPMPVFART